MKTNQIFKILLILLLTVFSFNVKAQNQEYVDRFMELYDELHNPANGYFSADGAPYHSIETLIVEAPDHGHEVTSEGYSFYIWLEVMYGKVTGDWGPLTHAWNLMETQIIPTTEMQPTNDAYVLGNGKADYVAEQDTTSKYPSLLQSSIPTGKEPVSKELYNAYGTSEIYGMHWLLDGDNFYGYGNLGDGVSTPSYINTFQRGETESTWETVPHPSYEVFNWGGTVGFLDLFVKEAAAPASQWKYTNAPDADARVVQAMYWAYRYAEEQGKLAAIQPLLDKASKMGDYLRLAMFDKYFKPMGVQSKTGPGVTDMSSAHYLMSWYYAWGGPTDETQSWAWRIGCSHVHFGYQNPVAAYALSQFDPMKPISANGADNWGTNLDRSLEFYQWLQSPEGAIAGGATNSWNGDYEAYPAGKATFYDMAYDDNPVYHDPGSGTWFGWQAWSMERMAEYYYITGDRTAKTIMDKWVGWAITNSQLIGTDDFKIPGTLKWEGQPDTWNPANPGSNSGLSVVVTDLSQDVGVTGCFAKALIYYAAATQKHDVLNTEAKEFGKQLLDRLWNTYRDDKGISTTESRGDYKRFFEEKIYFPAGWSGTMANGDVLTKDVSFLDMRSDYRNDPDYARLEASYLAGEDFTQNYHRTWAQIDIALANAEYAFLFGPETPCTGVEVSPLTSTTETTETVQLTASVLPANATNKQVTWSSDNSAIATVSSSGLVTGVSTGTAIITVTTVDGGFTANSTITVIPFSGQAPTAVIAATPTKAKIPFTVSFNGSGSIDPDGGALTYAWNFGDGTSSTLAAPTHDYIIEGNYTVTLVVTDPTGKTGSATQLIEATNISIDGLSVEYKCNELSASAGSVRKEYRIVNNSNQNLPLNKFKIRYWFTKDGATSQNFFCDYAQVGSGNISGSFVNMSPATSDADNYLEISISGTSTLNAGSNSGQIQTRFAKSDWQNYTQTNDYSFDASALSFTENTNVTLYYDGELVFGDEPGAGGNRPPVAVITPSATSGIAPLTVTFNGSGSSDPDGDAITFLWNSGETTSSISKTYTAAGTYIVSLTVSDGSLSNETSVSIVVTGAPVSVTSVSVNPISLNLTPGQTGSVIATVAPANATDKSVVWTSSNTAAATVNQSGVVTAVADGNAVITVTTNDGGFQATCNVLVETQIEHVTSVTVNPSSVSIVEGNSEQLAATVLPSNATDKSVTWTSSNSAVATVSQTGLVTAFGEGSALITATSVDGSFTDNCNVTVTSDPGCSFNVPQASPLASLNKAYSNIHVIGNGPNLSNVTNFTINWDLPNNGLWQLSMNTNNGQPSWWNDLNPKATQSFGSANPAIFLSGTGFPGLDGNYWVTMDGTNLVWVEKTGAYTIYFSTNAADPCGAKSATIATSIAKQVLENVSIRPNPASEQLTITGLENVSKIEIVNILGQLKYSNAVDNAKMNIYLSDFKQGTYIVNLYLKTGEIVNKKLMVK